MYSVVLMMAMTNSPDLASFGGRKNGCDGGCHGCTGYVAASCYGCNGGCNGCHGGRAPRRERGCHGGCHGCYGGCYGGCHGYTACGCTGYTACGCHGYVMTGCYGSGGGCWGVPAGPAPGGTPMPVKPTTPGTPPVKPMDTRAAAPATIVVSLPQGAKLMVDGLPTRSTAAVRTFATPELTLGQSFYYTLTAEIVRDGRTLTATEKVTVRAGETSSVALPDSLFAQQVALK